ncbi:MAG: ABC transporter ATP-binding protein [Desulfobacteraceae bacterium]|nr:ABC transporter ATP-binding protein [Desulfobacteraceae bacterium]
MNKVAIKVKNLVKKYNDSTIIDNLSFEVPEGICFGILGPNGAGKTTTMEILYGKVQREQTNGTNGHEARESKEVSVFGYDPLDNELEIKFITGIIPQEDNFDVELSVFQNLLIYSKFYGLSKKQALPRIEYVLEFIDLTQKKDSRIRELSGGMKRRLLIARALLNDPKLLILDEPTTGLDPQVRHHIWNKLRILKKEGVTILLTTHYMEEAYQICDSLIIMDKGKKISQGTPIELIEKNIEKYVLEIIKNNSKFKGDNSPVLRVETSHDRTLIYSDNLDEIKRISNDFSPGDYYLRQSNLEDVFLKITGKRFNE